MTVRYRFPEVLFYSRLVRVESLTDSDPEYAPLQ